MIGFIFSLTLRQLLRRKSTLVLALLALTPVLLAVVFRISQPDVVVQHWTARVLYLGLVVTAVLPLTALLLGTSVLGDEFEDGTALYLLTKPLSRWQILVPKIAAAWVLTSALLLTTTVVSGVIALNGAGGSSIVAGFGVAVVAGGLAYSTVFVLLSVLTSRALIIGLIYVFLWEGAITALFPGTDYLSIRHCTLGIAHWIAGTPPDIFDAYVGGVTSVVLIAIAVFAAGVLANSKLQEYEVRDSS
jgi:ABC-2 type transport system permease protein